MNETILERDEILHYYGSNMRITFSKVHLFCLLVLKCSDKLITTSYKKKGLTVVSSDLSDGLAYCQLLVRQEPPSLCSIASLPVHSSQMPTEILC